MNFRQTLSRFFAPFLNNHIWSSLIFLFVEMLSYIVIVVNTELFRRLMLVLEQGGPYDQILLYGSVMVALLIGIFTLQLLTYKHWVYAFVGWTRGVVKEYVYRYLRLDHEEVLKYGTGKMLSIVNSGKDSWATAIDMLVMWGIPILTGYIANLIFIGYVDSRLIPYVLVFTVLVLLWGHWVNTRTLEFRKKRKEAKDKSVGYVVKMIMEKFTILKHDKWNQEWDKLNGFINQYENWAIRTDWYLKLMFSGTRFISDSARVAMILILAWFVYDGTGSISSVAAVVISSNFISNYVIRIGDLYKNITKISEDYTKMWDVFDKTPSIEGYDTGDDFQIKK
ncbi:MAG: ABC transporter transmembrane domain-containing protein [Patescibacteria group bacterium]|nr:ABC transporter transmembrane domain-containing protein [Patescibacteria group bacterium]